MRTHLISDDAFLLHTYDGAFTQGAFQLCAHIQTSKTTWTMLENRWKYAWLLSNCNVHKRRLFNALGGHQEQPIFLWPTHALITSQAERKHRTLARCLDSGFTMLVKRKSSEMWYLFLTSEGRHTKAWFFVDGWCHDNLCDNASTVYIIKLDSISGNFINFAVEHSIEIKFATLVMKNWACRSVWEKT